MTGLLAALKPLPRAYNKEIQEPVEPLLDCAKTVCHSLKIMLVVLGTLKVNDSRMQEALTVDMLATDVADYLVRKGVPFRDTHHIAGAVVKKAEGLGTSMDKVTLSDLK